MPSSGSDDIFEAQARKICTTLRRESDSEVKTWKFQIRRVFWSWGLQKLHPAVVPERFGSQNR